MTNDSTMVPPVKAAGIDVSKATFDVAIAGEPICFTADNTPQGHRTTAARLRELGVTRVGLEASGHYEAALAAYLRKENFTVVVLDPGQVHGYRRFKKKRAKTDKIDATLIAVVTAAIEEVRQPPDERLEMLAEHLTFLEQQVEDIARLKTRRDRYALPKLRAQLDRDIARLEKRLKEGRAELIAQITAHEDLARRFELARSVPGIGEVAALCVVVRMPELGHVSREEAAALVGVAPFNVDTGQHAGERHIAGGRERVRKVLYAATVAARYQWNPDIKVFGERLTNKGKAVKVVLIACLRKLVLILNAVLARGTPWLNKNAKTQHP